MISMKITGIKLYTIKSGDTGARGAAMGKPYNMPVIPHGASVYNYHFVMANANSTYAEYLSVGKGDVIRPIFAVLEDEPLPVNGKVTLDSNKPGFGVELKRELLVPFKG
jgi:L-rhamnonate dehydratase